MTAPDFDAQARQLSCGHDFMVQPIAAALAAAYQQGQQAERLEALDAENPEGQA